MWYHQATTDRTQLHLRDVVHMDASPNWQTERLYSENSSAYYAIAAQLTGREKQVLHLLSQGLLYKEIAANLKISTKTVEYHTSKILRKFKVKDRYELAFIKHLSDENQL